jgi:hypothetical protein
MTAPATDRPSFEELRAWRTTGDERYTDWVNRVQPFDGLVWDQQRADAAMISHRPLVSVLTPVYDTDPDVLRACIRSVGWQSYPWWQLVLVDDHSSRPETAAVLAEVGASDPRVVVVRPERKGGICGATNEALARAAGEWVVFLDHDDVLSPEALWWTVRTALAAPEASIVYSDRDAILPDGRRNWPFLKHGWSPEGLLSWNYVFHLTAYRTELVRRLGGYRPEYEGSQDLDLVLRAAELDPVVVHVPRILYHWRQSAASVFTDAANKPQTFSAGVAAVEAALRRRGLPGQVSEPPADIRGIYRVDLGAPTGWAATVRMVPGEAFVAAVTRACVAHADHPVVALVHGEAEVSDDDLAHLTGWMRVPGVVMATGRVVERTGEEPPRLLCAEVVIRADGHPAPLFRGVPAVSIPPMAMGARVHNVLVPNPVCLALRPADWLAAEIDPRLAPWDAVSAFGRWVLGQGGRGVFTPWCTATMAAHQWDALGNPVGTSTSQMQATRWLAALAGRRDPSVPERLAVRDGDVLPV